MQTRTRRGFFRDWCGVGAGKEGAGSEGLQSLFLFQPDRIGTLAQGEEIQTLSCDSRGRYDFTPRGK